MSRHSGDGPWAYSLELTRVADASAPGSLALLALGLAGLGAMRARQRRS
ncbi:PEP-CTERM sorting domain-containing protein [Marinobacter segnicrescens]|nr:PEP-CTERM sorting domain-containing protein [Marinobacter segnicrescens]